MPYLTLEEAAQYANHKTGQRIMPENLLRAGVAGILPICAPFGSCVMYNATTKENEDFCADLLIIPPTHLLEIETEGEANIQVAFSLDGKTIYFPHIKRTRDQLRVLENLLNKFIPHLIPVQQASIPEIPGDNRKANARQIETPKGVDKQTVILKFHGIYWSVDKWSKYLANPPNWLKDCRVSRGTKSKNNPSTWNPVQIAITLIDKGIPIKKLDAVFVSFKDWHDEWIEKSEYLR